jgi:hypothetical protein
MAGTLYSRASGRKAVNWPASDTVAESMCGRYTLSTPGDAVAELLDLATPLELAPRYNVAPTQESAVVRLTGGRRTLLNQRWGLVPYWAAEPGIGNRMINARSETVAEKPAFRSSLRRRRCLVPADGFFEWRRTPAGKQPYLIRLASATRGRANRIVHYSHDAAQQADGDAPRPHAGHPATAASRALARPARAATRAARACPATVSGRRNDGVSGPRPGQQAGQ